MSTGLLGNYLTDLGTLLKQEALDARTQASGESGQPGHQFALGRLTAYYEVLTLMKQQAAAFGLELAEVSLQGFDPERELLAATSRQES